MGTIEERNTLILDYLPLANKLAWKKWRLTPPSVDIDELKSAAYFGLVDSAEKYNVNRGVSFAVYASIRIHGAICDYLRELSWGPRSFPFVPTSLDVSDNDDNNLADIIEDRHDEHSDTVEFFEIISKVRAIIYIISPVVLFFYYIFTAMNSLL